MLNKGTLVGATLRPNDSADTYPVAYQEEIAGGRHTVDFIADRDAMPVHLRRAGMECYVKANGNTYQLENDLTTWTLKTAAGGGSTTPGSGGSSSTTQLISGNFGAWTSLTDPTDLFYDEQIPLKFKSDLLAFASRAIVYLRGQFGLLDTLTATEITLGNLPVNSRPAGTIKKYMICQNIEMHLVIEPGGDVKLVSLDGFNLPTGTGETEDQPYTIETFFNPEIGEYEPTIYTATREGDFTRDNCGGGYTGTTVTFSKDYTSTVDQDTAEAIADANFDIDGQAYANDPDNGATCELIPPSSAEIQNQTTESMTVILIPLAGGDDIVMGIEPGETQTIDIPAGNYNATVTAFSSTGTGLVNLNGAIQTGTSGYSFTDLTAPISGYAQEIM